MPINMANRLSVPPGDVRSLLQVEQGMQITKGDVLAKGIFGLMVESAQRPLGCRGGISDTTGQLIAGLTPVEVLAYLPGKSWKYSMKGWSSRTGGFDPRHLWDRW